MESIRGFSRPVFRVDLLPLFLDNLRELGLPDWVMIRERLYTSKADEIMDAMVLYKESFVLREAREKTWYSTKKTYPLDTAMEQVYTEMVDARNQERDTYEALCERLKTPAYDHEEDWRLTMKWMKPLTSRMAFAR